MALTIFNDVDFLEALVALLCRDLKTLRSCSNYLRPDDFKPLQHDPTGRSRWIVAERALEYYQKYQRPIQRLLVSDLISYADELSLGQRTAENLISYAKRLLKRRLPAPDSVVDKVIRYKQEILQAKAIEELIQLQTSGKLSSDKWLEITHRVVGTSSRNGSEPIPFFRKLDDRIYRRARQQRYQNCPFFLIEPLDRLVHGIGRGNLGMILAPYKRGKSLMLLHVALAFTIQHLNVMFVSMEDPIDVVEDRLDAMVASLPMKSLADQPKLLKRRFRQVARLTRDRLRLVDLTGEGATVSHIESQVLRERDKGFLTDALIIDYDEEILPSKRYEQKRLEFSDIYRDLRRLAARHQMIVWTASQTQANTQSLRIVDGDRTAEDKSKVRKVGMAIGMGQGDWGPDSIYLWVAAHKFDRMKVGCNIMSNKERMLIYDRERTRRAEEQAAWEQTDNS